MKKIDFNNRKEAKTAWNSTVARYMITGMNDILEQIDEIASLQSKYRTADDYGQVYKRYIASRIEYNNTLNDEEQLRDIVTIYILMVMLSDENYGVYTNTIKSMLRNVMDSGMLYLRMLYVKGKVNFIDIEKPETCIIPMYMVMDSRTSNKEVVDLTVYFSQRILAIEEEFADFIWQSADEVKGMKEASKTPNDFGLALKTYVEGRLSYIKYLRDTARLYNLSCLSHILAQYKIKDLGRYADEISKLSVKIAKSGSKILVNQAEKAGITLIDSLNTPSDNK